MTQYVQETHDAEMEKMEQQAIIDIKMGDKGITKMNKEIFKFDQAQDDDNFDPDDVGGMGDDNF